jgi:hypothetical protein
VRSDNRKDKRLEEIEAKWKKETNIQTDKGKEEATHTLITIVTDCY